MINKKYIFNIGIFFVVITGQLYWPVIHLGKNSAIPVQADIILIYITVLAIIYGRFTVIIIGFIAALLYDFSTQSNLLGIFPLSKSISAYCLGSIFSYKTIWSKKIQYSVVFLSYLLHFFIYFYFAFRGLFLDELYFYYFLSYVIINSTITFILLIIWNHLVYKNRLL